MSKKFKTSDVSRLLGVSSYTVINWINSGILQAYETIGGHYRIMREDLVNFMKKKNMPLIDELRSKEELQTKKYKVLIVDDEENVVESIKVILEDLGVELELETAFDGVEAGIKLIKFLPNLVILDAVMPRADGDRVVKLIREHEELKKTKILVYTGYPEEGKKLLKLGTDRVIEKSSPEDNPHTFRKEVCKLLGVKYSKVAKNGSYKK